MLEGILDGIIDVSLLRKAMQFYTGVDIFMIQSPNWAKAPFDVTDMAQVKAQKL